MGIETAQRFASSKSPTIRQGTFYGEESEGGGLRRLTTRPLDDTVMSGFLIQACLFFFSHLHRTLFAATFVIPQASFLAALSVILPGFSLLFHFGYGDLYLWKTPFGQFLYVMDLTIFSLRSPLLKSVLNGRIYDFSFLVSCP